MPSSGAYLKTDTNISEPSIGAEREHDAEIRIACRTASFTIMTAQKSDISEEEQERTTSDNAEHQFTRALEFTPKEERFDVLFKIGSQILR